MTLLTVAKNVVGLGTTLAKAQRERRMLLWLVAAVALALFTTAALAQKTAPGDKVYVLHSEAQGTCPALNWHIVASPDGVLSGKFAFPDRKMTASVSGSIVGDLLEADVINGPCEHHWRLKKG